MRSWIEYLITNATAYNDFIDWALGSETELQKKLVNVVKKGEMTKASGIAHEIEVYENMRKKIQAEARERVSQAKHEEKGGNQ